MVAAVNRAGVAAIEVMPARAIDMQGVAIAGRVRDVGQRLLHLVVQSRIGAGDDVIADANRHRQQHVELLHALKERQFQFSEEAHRLTRQNAATLLSGLGAFGRWR